jgi:hypothetical protein
MERQGFKAGALLALLAFFWAAPLRAAHSFSPRSSVPAPVRLREIKSRGLLVDVWFGNSGPYVFAVDTGAGGSLITTSVANRAGLSLIAGRKQRIGGLAGSMNVSGQETILSNLALGQPDNIVSSRQRALVVLTLPSGVDGILDPTETYAPLGYVLDLPNHELRAFESSLRIGNEPPGGTIVRWVREGAGRRPFVRLGDNRLALIDTGSGFGLGLTYDAIVAPGNRRAEMQTVRDVSGGAIQSRRVAPSTVSIGSLVLEKVPTDVLIGAHEGAPVILGRDALYPFRITFDPTSKLIEIAPG